MKKLLFLPIFAILMSFSQCDRSKFDEKSPVDFSDIYIQDWVGGRPGSSGTMLTLKSNKADNSIVFDSIYFNKKAIKLESQLHEGKLTLIANFVKKNRSDKDLNLSSNPQEEFGNKPTNKTTDFPFELNDDEAIISYFIKEEKRYYKLSKIRKEKTLYYQ